MSRLCRRILSLICIFIFVPELSASPGRAKYHIRDGHHMPCSFFDTVNVTSDVRFTNGSYLHDGVLIPAHLVGTFDYVYKDLVTEVKVSPHLRGCVCKLKPCISFCCPWGTVYSPNETLCVSDADEREWPTTINVTLANSSLQTVDIFEQFAVQSFRPCEAMFILMPELFESDKWRLFENGSILREYDNTYFRRYEYCMMPTVSNTTDTMYVINPANCDFSSEIGTMKIINVYAMLFSIPFMMLTIIVYLSISELRNQHGKSLVCYLFGLIIGYSVLCCNSLIADLRSSGTLCKVIGYIAYYFFMAAFFWLSVISFDLWHNFRGTRGVNRSEEKKRFLVYSLYSWGLPVMFLVFTWYAQEKANIPAYYKPGISDGSYCWLNMSTWSAMIYFFGPILVIIVANIVMFVMTAIKIDRVQCEMARIMAREDSTRSLRTEKDKFGLFLRLFLVMGVTWSLEIISYFVGQDKAWSKIFYVADMCNAIQGFLIFMLFVMKKKVKQLITKRLFKRQSSPPTSKTNSTNSSNLNIDCHKADTLQMKAKTEKMRF